MKNWKKTLIKAVCYFLVYFVLSYLLMLGIAPIVLSACSWFGLFAKLGIFSGMVGIGGVAIEYIKRRIDNENN